MANFSPSNLAKAQAILQGKYKDAEGRFKPSPVLALGLQNQSILLPDAASLRTREDRTVEAYLLARSIRTAGTARAYNHAGSRGDSITQTLSWGTYSDKFSISLKQLDNNIFGFEAVLAQQIENCMKTILEAAETALVTLLQSERTEINAATSGGTFNATNDAFEISDATRLTQIMKSMMRQNNYKGEFDVIANSIGYINGEYYMNQGGGNSTNLGFQFSGTNWVESYELADANYTTADVLLVMPTGSFASLPWIPKQNRMGHGDYNSVLGGYGSIADPWGMGLNFAVHGYATRADTSASNGNVQDDLMEFELSVDIANPISPLSVATETPIFEVAKV